MSPEGRRETPTPTATPRPFAPADPLLGTIIGRYRLVSRIGYGGMGVVYRAVRADTHFQQQVAIKLISRGMDTDFIVGRFRNERQILASFDHPYIARLLDGGATSDGLPYFVMEYIEGKPLLTWCDEHKLSTTDRLELFRKVCSAVQYAHQNLIVHRDLKPGNILITEDGTPKLLDFGIAKILSLEMVHQPTDPTVTGFRMMTPEYASPEQARGENVTTASDTYSLGVILYELLTGRRPYRLTARGTREIEEVICKQQPERPSTAVYRAEEVNGASVTPQLVSAPREGSPERLRKRLRGDLDNIVLMALRKEPARRYSSVEQFSEDIRRHLQGFAVLARGDGFGYRSLKFVTRHKSWVAAAALIALSLVAGIIAVSWQALILNRERLRAEHRFNDVRKLANSVMFEVHDSIERLPGSTRARELIVQKALEYIDSLAHETTKDPTLSAELALVYQKIGDVQGRPYKPNLGNTAGALENYRKALEIDKSLLATNPANEDVRRNLADSHGRLAALYEVMGNSYKAREHADKELELRLSLLDKQPDSRIRMSELATAYLGQANSLQLSGDWPRVKESRRKAIQLFEELVTKDPADNENRRNLGNAYMRASRTLMLTQEHEAALAMQRKSLVLEEAVLKTNPADTQMQMNVSFNYHYIGMILGAMGDPSVGLENSRKAVEIREGLLAVDPVDARTREELSNSYGVTGNLLLSTGKASEAMDYFRKQLTFEETLAENDPLRLEHQTGTASAQANIASVYWKMAARPSKQRVENLRAARDWYRKANTIYSALRIRGLLSAEFSQNPKEIARKIAECDAELKPTAPDGHPDN